MKRALCFLGVAVSLALAAPKTETSDGEQEGQIWAVLVAGSNGWINYRHQANICHAYQIFHSNGVPDSNIIVMMYDDIANNLENPFPGKLFNKPHGPDVYQGVKKDYTGEDVTPENFINVLTGNKKGGGKVLESGPNDRVFITFSDHGGTGVIDFPNSYLHAYDLIKALKTMHEFGPGGQTAALVFYLEACESGSMFNNILPNDINIFATTASRPDEHSYGKYCYNKSTVVGTCMADEFSSCWMEDIDKKKLEGKLTEETLLEQFKLVKRGVKLSEPQEYGDTKNIPKDKVEEYFGVPKKTYSNKDSQSSTDDSEDIMVSSWEMAVHYLNNKINQATNKHERDELLQKKDDLLQGRRSVDELFRAILTHVTELDITMVKELEEARPALSLEMMPCYRTIVDSFNENCVNISKNTYALRHLYKFANLCLSQYSEEDVLQALSVKCEESHRQLTEIH